MATTPVSREFEEVLEQFGEEPFSAYDFTLEYAARFPQSWAALEAKYGRGGKGQGSYYTVSTYIAHQLLSLSRQNIINRLDYRPAPDDHGNRIIRYWSVGGSGNDEGVELDESESEVVETAPALDEEFREGSVRLRTHLRKERHWRLARAKRQAFLKEHGKLYCERCEMDPEASYGSPIGNAAIEVHHTIPVGVMQPDTKVELSDLQCLCANCHRVVHAEMRGT